MFSGTGNRKQQPRGLGHFFQASLKVSGHKRPPLGFTDKRIREVSPTLGLDVSLCLYICSGSPGLPLKLSFSCPRLCLGQAPCLLSQKIEKPLTPRPHLLLWSGGLTPCQPRPDASNWWLLCNFPVQMS